MNKQQYIIAIDQSTQGTKALLFDEQGKLIKRKDCSHEQIVNEEGWISHNPLEIYENTITVVKQVIKEGGINKNQIVGIGISNQRETSLAWNKMTGEPLENAIVWQCKRAKALCEKIQKQIKLDINRITGIPLSPYFPAAKISWLLEHVDGAKELAKKREICHGTMDSWLLFKLTKGQVYKTDYSNASRTQLFNLETLQWDKDICKIFGIEIENLATICDSNSEFGTTDLEGYLEIPIPIHGILGDSHGALFGQGCLEAGMAKATYGTGSSVMLNTGNSPIFSERGVVTSLAWGIDGKITYVLEGNINYTGAVIRWLQEDLGLISSAKETEELARAANTQDETYFVPAFTGLGAPYWDNNARAMLSGITRITGKAELVKAALDCIAYQITDVVNVMQEEMKSPISTLRVDGGPTRNKYLMQFQSDMLEIPVEVPEMEELSGMGVAYMVGLALHIYHKDIFEKTTNVKFCPSMKQEERREKIAGWKEAIQLVLKKQ